MFTGELATDATSDSPPGTYEITQGTLSAGDNYTITFTRGTLTVTGLGGGGGGSSGPLQAYLVSLGEAAVDLNGGPCASARLWTSAKATVDGPTPASP